MRTQTSLRRSGGERRAGTTIVRLADTVREPWANGLGWTREVARDGGADWTWRLSVAESTAPAEFSHFDGVERALFLLRGRSLRLTFADSRDVVLTEPAQMARFSGGSRVTGIPDRAGTEQLNLMWRPDLVRAYWTVLVGPAEAQGPQAPDAIRLWHVVDGFIHVGDLLAGAGSTVIAGSRGERAEVDGTAVEITLTPA